MRFDSNTPRVESRILSFRAGCRRHIGQHDRRPSPGAFDLVICPLPPLGPGIGWPGLRSMCVVPDMLLARYLRRPKLVQSGSHDLTGSIMDVGKWCVGWFDLYSTRGDHLLFMSFFVSLALSSSRIERGEAKGRNLPHRPT